MTAPLVPASSPRFAHAPGALPARYEPGLGNATRCVLRNAVLVLAGVALGGCALVDKPVRPVVYDFGPGETAAAPASPAAPVLLLQEVEAGSALDSTAVLFRLAYADVQQLQPYAQARWSMAPAQLLRQRLRDTLSRSAAVLAPGEGAMGGASMPALVLHVELEEFSQVFESPERSLGLVRVRATLLRGGVGGDKLLGQRSFVAQRPAPSADAPGGVRAMTAACAAVVDDLQQWLTTLQ